MDGDKQLLMDAAKAAGLELAMYQSQEGGLWLDRKHANPITHSRDWNPLTDDGDALRLAVKLKLAIHHSFSVGSEGAFNVVTVWHQKQTSDEGVCIKFECDIYEATRRAIVKAAAEIGKSL